MFADILTTLDSSDKLYDMITTFLIVSLIIFILSLAINLLAIGFSIGNGDVRPEAANVIGTIIYLAMISFNIVAIASL